MNIISVAFATGRTAELDLAGKPLQAEGVPGAATGKERHLHHRPRLRMCVTP